MAVQQPPDALGSVTPPTPHDDALERFGWSPPVARVLKPGIRVNIRGRSVKLRGLRRAPTGLFAWLAILGPGVISSAAGDDAGGIATNSTIGAQFGYELLWVLLILTVSLAVVQEMAARLGAATGRGLLDLVRERYGIGWALLAIAAILLANGGIVVSEFAGIAAAAELFGLSRFIAVPLSAALIWFSWQRSCSACRLERAPRARGYT